MTATVGLGGCSATDGNADPSGASNGSAAAGNTTAGTSDPAGGGTGAAPSAPTGTATTPAPMPTTTGTTAEPSPTGEPPATDPGSVTFSWPEADLSGGGGGCKSGRYTGEFAGVYTSPATVIGLPLEVSGQVDFTLNETQQGEFFEIAEGRVVGTAQTGGNGMVDPQSGIPFSADIVGTLNCTTGTLENAGLQNGVYTVAGFLEGYFEGPITGVYDKSTSSFPQGTWSVVEPNQPPQFGGSGTWSAQWTP